MSRRFVIAVACCALSSCGGSDGSGDKSARAGTGNGAVSSGGGTEPGGRATGGAGTSGDGSGALSAGGEAFEPIYGRWGEEPQNTFTLPLPPAAAGALPEPYHPETDVATLSPDKRAVTYAKGAVVVHQGTLYRALVENTGKAPEQNPTEWKALPPPADDVRLAADSPHAGLGVRWPPVKP